MFSFQYIFCNRQSQNYYILKGVFCLLIAEAFPNPQTICGFSKPKNARGFPLAFNQLWHFLLIVIRKWHLPFNTCCIAYYNHFCWFAMHIHIFFASKVSIPFTYFSSIYPPFLTLGLITNASVVE